jgi:hypothetical protein
MNHPVTRHDLELLERRIMSALSDKITALSTVVDTAIAELATLRDKLESDGVTPADLAAIDAIQAKLHAAVTPPAPSNPA